MPSTEYHPPEARRVLVLAPHPDDEALGCGGTIALYTSHGTEVRVAFVSDGGKISLDADLASGDIVGKRRQESVEVSRVLGVRKTYFLDFPDGGLRSCLDGIEERIDDIVRQFGPDVIFSTSPFDGHDDHVAVSEIAVRLLNKNPGVRVAFYEVLDMIRFNHLVDITAVADIKERAISGYKYSLFGSPEVFSEAIRGRDRFRSCYTRRVNYYESFWAVSGPLDKSGIMEWLTYGTMGRDPAAVFLSRLKAVDELFFELKKTVSALKERDRRIEELEEMRKVRSWRRRAKKFYTRGRDMLLSGRLCLRNLYHKARARIRSGEDGK